MPHIADHRRIANDIRARITSGDLRPGDQLPSITQLKQRYGVSATPVKNALLVLQTEGHTEAGRGAACSSSSADRSSVVVGGPTWIWGRAAPPSGSGRLPGALAELVGRAGQHLGPHRPPSPPDRGTC